ncbi:MAG: n-acetylglutamate synthase [Vicinamibacterales bacterium]
MQLRVNYEGRIFQPVAPADQGPTDATAVPGRATPGEVGPDTRFHYHQHGEVVWATYAGGQVKFGTLIGVVDEGGRLDARYQQVGVDGTFKAGRCRSTPEFLYDGRLRLHESWTWTDGASGSGHSIIEEL